MGIYRNFYLNEYVDIARSSIPFHNATSNFNIVQTPQLVILILAELSSNPYPLPIAHNSSVHNFFLLNMTEAIFSNYNVKK